MSYATFWFEGAFRDARLARKLSLALQSTPRCTTTATNGKVEQRRVLAYRQLTGALTRPKCYRAMQTSHDRAS